jgi:uncharacterized protein (TIGR02466 family)
MSNLIDSIFRVPVYYDNININTDKLKKHILKIEKKSKSLINSNVGGFHTDYFNLEDSLFKELINKINEVVGVYFNFCKFKKTNLKIKNMWAIVNGHKDFNVSHYHPHALFSGAFYVSFPKNAGNIVFQHPSHFMCDWDLLKKETYNEYNSSSWKYDVKEKDMFLFPSWLWHKVMPNLSKQKRIVISFNIGF